MRHLHSRQYLGTALILCDNPFPTLRVARKQWLKLARTIQRERSSTLNADKILKFTYAITHMQHMHFTAKPAHQAPGAQVFFADGREPLQIPQNCATVYLATELPEEKLITLIPSLAESALVVDYANKSRIDSIGLKPKLILEQAVAEAWKEVELFCAKQDINLDRLAQNQLAYVDAMDDTLDTLLGVSTSFLRVASNFQRAFELAQPLRATKTTQKLYDTLTVLAYRVQALSPGTFSQYLLRSYHENETYFLHDIAADLVPEGESLLETVGRHKQAGRMRLALAILSSLERLRLPDDDAPAPDLL